MNEIGELIGERRLVVILRGMDATTALPIAEEVWRSGAGLVEVPIQDAEAVDALRVLCARGAELGEAVGAGTVLTTAHVDIAARAGAAFTVAPGLSDDVVRAAVAAGLAHLPGVASATDVDRALDLGCGWLKVFPASSLGPDWIAAMHGPFPDARFVATGGITPGNAREFLDAGAHALGVGSSIATPAELTAMIEATR